MAPKGDQEPSEPVAGADVALAVRLQPGDPIRGDVRCGDGAEPVTFHGWVGLMTAINRLRALGD